MKWRSDQSAIEAFTDEELRAEVAHTMSRLTAGFETVPYPKAILLGGQSGAGKTTLHKLLRCASGAPSISINGDEYRKSHPRFDALQREYGDAYVSHTAAWSGAMTEALIDRLSANHYNLIIEGTLRTSSVPLKTARLLRGRGYGVSLALMAVKPEISLISCQIRYEQMKLAGTTPRATDPAHHARIVREIVANLANLEKSGVFDEVYLYDREGRCRYPQEGYSGSAADKLAEILFGPWTTEERGHLAFLERVLDDLRKSP